MRIGVLVCQIMCMYLCVGLAEFGLNRARWNDAFTSTVCSSHSMCVSVLCCVCFDENVENRWKYENNEQLQNKTNPLKRHTRAQLSQHKRVLSWSNAIWQNLCCVTSCVQPTVERHRQWCRRQAYYTLCTIKQRILSVELIQSQVDKGTHCAKQHSILIIEAENRNNIIACAHNTNKMSKELM